MEDFAALFRVGAEELERLVEDGFGLAHFAGAKERVDLVHQFGDRRGVAACLLPARDSVLHALRFLVHRGGRLWRAGIFRAQFGERGALFGGEFSADGEHEGELRAFGGAFAILEFVELREHGGLVGSGLREQLGERVV